MDLTQWRIRVEDAILYLDSVCDGAHSEDGHGFNGRDSRFGKSVAAQVRDMRAHGRRPGSCLLGKQFTVIERMVTTTYRTQLSKAGLEMDRPNTMAPAPKPEMAPAATEQAVQAPVAVLATPAPRPAARPPRPAPVAVADVDLDDLSWIEGLSIPDLLAAMEAHFPGWETRPAQREAMYLMYRVLTNQADDSDLVMEIGTGGGKSLILILSALAAYARSKRPIILSTQTKALQMQYRAEPERLGPALAQIRPFTMAEVKGRRNYLCLKLYREKLDELEATGVVGARTAEGARQFLKLVPWAKQTETGDLEDLPFSLEPSLKGELTTDSKGCIAKRCPFYVTCYANRAIDRSEKADITVVNTYLLMEHLRILDDTEGFAGVLRVGVRNPNVVDRGKPDLFIDEAHGLEEVARKALGAEVGFNRFRYVCDRTAHYTYLHKIIAKAQKAAAQGKQLADPVEQQRADAYLVSADRWERQINGFQAVAERTFADLMGSMDGKQQRRLGDETPILGGLVVALRLFTKLLVDQRPLWLDEDETAMWEKLIDQARELLLEYQACAEAADPTVTIRFAEVTKPDDDERQPYITLNAQPVDVGPLLHRVLWSQFAHVVAVSATIAGPDGLDFWRRRVGAPDTEELIQPAPFDYRQRTLLYLPENSAAFDPRGSRDFETLGGRTYLEHCISEMEQLVEASRGGAFLLFTSKKALEAVRVGVRETVDHETGEVIPQVRGLEDRLRGRYLTLAQGDAPRSLLVDTFKENGNAVLLGLKTYWEGVDVPGPALRLVVIHQFPFAPPDDPVWEALCDAITMQGGKWFQDLALPTATIACKQAFGRLMRRMTDWGVVALLDGRAGGQAKYGQRIIRALPPALQTRRLEDVQAFYHGWRTTQP